jgi:hypothetical protein
LPGSGLSYATTNRSAPSGQSRRTMGWLWIVAVLAGFWLLHKLGVR